jgi:hypothetical protein
MMSVGCQAFAGELSWTIIVDHMRREFLITIFIAVSLNAFPQSPPLHSSNSVDAATQVKLQEEALRQAELRYDVRAADALLSGDFVLTAASDGTLRSKSEFLPMIGDKSDPWKFWNMGPCRFAYTVIPQ